MEEGLSQAIGQIDAVLDDLRAFASDLPATAQILGDTTVRVSRVIRGTIEQVWAAHHDPALLSQWLLDPDGWSLPTCETATEVGQTYRYVWQEDGSGRSFGSTGELLEVAAPYRVVTTERMYGDGIPDDAPGTVHELTLTHVEGGTLLAIVITYPDAATRDAVVGTGMVGGRGHATRAWSTSSSPAEPRSAGTVRSTPTVRRSSTGIPASTLP